MHGFPDKHSHLAAAFAASAAQLQDGPQMHGFPDKHSHLAAAFAASAAQLQDGPQMHGFPDKHSHFSSVTFSGSDVALVLAERAAASAVPALCAGRPRNTWVLRPEAHNDPHLHGFPIAHSHFVFCRLGQHFSDLLCVHG